MNFDQHWETVLKASDETFNWYIDYLASGHKALQLTNAQEKVVRKVYKEAWRQYLAAAKSAYSISQQSLAGNYANEKRSPYFNKHIAQSYKSLRTTYVDKGFISILGGIVLVNQSGSIKQVYLDSLNSEPVLDMMGSATTLNLGAGFPLFAAIDLIENFLGIGENFALVYHSSVYQQLCFDFLVSLYPNQAAEPQIFSESSGTAVNSVSIEAVSAYAEKLGMSKESRLLAFKGTWSGGFGTAKEASSFGATDQLVKKSGPKWIDRCLEIPHNKSGEKRVLSSIKQKIDNGEANGIIFEKIIGDSGIIELSDSFVTEIVNLLKNAPSGRLPIIIDEIQAGNGRSSSNYWSFSHLPEVNAYSHLLITNAKSTGGGKPYAYALMPKVIAEAAYPLSMLTTHSGNGPIGRAVTYAKFIAHPMIKSLKNDSAIAVNHELKRGLGNSWRGRHLNIGLTTSGNEQSELLQHYLYMQYGVLVGSFPATLRFQPNLIEYPGTLTNVIRIIEQAMIDIQSVKPNQQAKLITKIEQKIKGQQGGGLNI